MYVFAPLPVKVVDPPTQYAASGPAFTSGNGFITTVVVAVAIQPLRFVVNVYVPAAAAVAGNVGFCNVDVKPFGPVQL